MATGDFIIFFLGTVCKRLCSSLVLYVFVSRPLGRQFVNDGIPVCRQAGIPTYIQYGRYQQHSYKTEPYNSAMQY